MPIKKKLLLAFFCYGLVPLVLFGIYGYYSISHVSKQFVKSQFVDMANTEASYLDLIHNLLKQQVDLITSRTQLRKSLTNVIANNGTAKKDLALIQKILSDAHEHLKQSIEFINIHDPMGKIIASTSSHPQDSVVADYTPPQQEYIRLAPLRGHDDKYCLIFNTRFNDPHLKPASITVAFKLDKVLYENSYTGSRWTTAEVNIVDLNELKMYRKINPSQPNLSNGPQVLEPHILRQIKKNFTLGSSRPISFTTPDSLVVFNPNSKLNLGLLHQTSLAEINQPANEFALVFLIFVVVVSIILGLGAIFLAGRVTKPINDLIDYAKSISTNHKYMKKKQDFQESPDEIKTLDRSLRDMTDRLINVNKDLEVFARITAHDLKEPVRNVNLCAEHLDLISDKPDINHDTMKAYINKISRNSRKMHDMIQGLQLITSLDLKTPVFEKININQVIGDSIEIHSDDLKKNNFKINLLHHPHYIFGNSSLLLDLYSNLISNAIRHDKSPNKSITFTANYSGPNTLVLGFISSSALIPAEEAKKVFNLYYKHASSSTGVGLAVCRRIVEWHGGQIWLDTESGENHFKFSLSTHPIKKVSEQKEATHA